MHLIEPAVIDPTASFVRVRFQVLQWERRRRLDIDIAPHFQQPNR